MIKSTRPLKTKEEVVALRAKKARISRAKKRMYVTGRLSRSEWWTKDASAAVHDANNAHKSGCFLS